MSHTINILQHNLRTILTLHSWAYSILSFPTSSPSLCYRWLHTIKYQYSAVLSDQECLHNIQNINSFLNAADTKHILSEQMFVLKKYHAGFFFWSSEVFTANKSKTVVFWFDTMQPGKWLSMFQRIMSPLCSG